MKGLILWGDNLNILPGKAENFLGAKPPQPEENICQACQGLLLLGVVTNRLIVESCKQLVHRANMSEEQGSGWFGLHTQASGHALREE